MHDDLELLDCGSGRRLERFGPVVVDRPAPGARDEPALDRSAWLGAALRFGRHGWDRGREQEPWIVEVGGLAFECRPASGGQVGIFPEHARTWTWLDLAVRQAIADLGRPPEVLSLFAYTGGSTLACARAGARVAHVDASRPAVAWARRNAELSGLADRPIRWLVDDAGAFARRERRRGRRYDGLVLDPPSYGHGQGSWRIEDDLPALLDDLAALTGPRPAFILLSAHTPGFDGPRLAAMVRERFGIGAIGDELGQTARSGNVLRLGAWARFPAHPTVR